MELPEGTHIRKSIEIKEVRNGYLILLNTLICNGAGQPIQTFQEQEVATHPNCVGDTVHSFLNTDLLAAPSVPDTSADHFVDPDDCELAGN